MPMQEYQCKKCKYVFNVSGTFKFFDSYKPVCPNCKSENVLKKIFATPFIFKKSGD